MIRFALVLTLIASPVYADCGGSLSSCSGVASCSGSLGIVLVRRTPVRDLVARSLQRLQTRTLLRLQALGSVSCTGPINSCAGNVKVVPIVRSVVAVPVRTVAAIVQNCPNGQCPTGDFRPRLMLRKDTY